MFVSTGLPVAAAVQIIKPFLKLSPDEPQFRANIDWALSKPKIIAAGKHGHTAQWRFEERKLFEQNSQITLGVVLAIPVRQHTLRIGRILSANRSQHTLTAYIERLERMIGNFKGDISGQNIPQLLDRLKRASNHRWDVRYDNLPLWDLSIDLQH